MPFVDAQVMNRQNPTTFSVPSEAELKEIKPGVYVKVCASNERFWVLVTSHDGVDIGGVIDNDLVFTEHGLKCGELIHFQERHVYAIYEQN